MFCRNCGIELPDDAKFCSSCGVSTAEKPKKERLKRVRPKKEKIKKEKPVKEKISAGKKMNLKKAVRILLICVGVLAAALVALLLFNNRTVAKIPDPEDFFGVNGREGSSGFDVSLLFEVPNDPKDMLDEYCAYITENTENIEFRFLEGDNSKYVITYSGPWLKDSRTLVRIINYGNDYYGADSENRNYVFRFMAESNCKFMPWDTYIPDHTDHNPDVPAQFDTEERDTSELTENVQVGIGSEDDAPAQTEGTVAISNPTLPDPGAFLGGIAPVEDEPGDVSGWHVYYRTSFEEGYEAAHEYVELLTDPRFGFTLTDCFDDTTLYLLEEYYFFDYAGKTDITPAQDRYYFDDYYDFSADVFVWVQKNGRDGYTGVSVYYSSDLAVLDLGDRASAVPDYTGGSTDSEFPDTEYEKPDFAKLPCLTCGGDGDCTECGGYGTVQRYNGDGEYIDSSCPDCYGNGKCRSCGGSGTRE